jgi:Zn-dependent peptidase ImmA (M78 family)
MTDRRTMQREAAKQALRQRNLLDISPTQPVPIIDMAHRLGLQVWFRDAKSYDGYYNPGSPPIIVLSSLRPLGRTHFTCAHELGHHIFGHGQRLDEDVYGSKVDDDERVANTFAAHFLMPRVLVDHALETRSIRADELQPGQVFRLASWLGVGFATLLTHLCYSLHLINVSRLRELKKCNLQKLKAEMVGTTVGRQDVLRVDRQWRDRSIDCRIGDYIVSDQILSLEKGYLEEVTLTPAGYVYCARVVGEDSCTTDDWRTAARISRGGRTVRAIYLYEEEVADD